MKGPYILRRNGVVKLWNMRRGIETEYQVSVLEPPQFTVLDI